MECRREGDEAPSGSVSEVALMQAPPTLQLAQAATARRGGRSISARASAPSSVRAKRIIQFVTSAPGEAMDRLRSTSSPALGMRRLSNNVLYCLHPRTIQRLVGPEVWVTTVKSRW